MSIATISGWSSRQIRDILFNMTDKQNAWKIYQDLIKGNPDFFERSFHEEKKMTVTTYEAGFESVSECIGWSPPIDTLIFMGHQRVQERCLDSLEYHSDINITSLTFVFKFLENVGT